MFGAVVRMRACCVAASTTCSPPGPGCTHDALLGETLEALAHPGLGVLASEPMDLRRSERRLGASEHHENDVAALNLRHR